MDTLILGSSLQSFVLFVLVHALVLIIFKNKHMLLGTRVLYVLVIAYNVYVMESYPVILTLLSSFMLSLYVYSYYLCVAHILFGTSLYVKLITLLDGGEPKSLEDIRAACGAKDILDSHLKQLIDAKVVRCLAKGEYELAVSKDIFLISSVRKALKALVNISST